MMKSTLVSRARRKRLATAERVRLWRIRHGGAAKLSDVDPEQDERRKRAIASFMRGHKHTCLTPSCRKIYSCRNACDPHGDGLVNSICATCMVTL